MKETIFIIYDHNFMAISFMQRKDTHAQACGMDQVLQALPSDQSSILADLREVDVSTRLPSSDSPKQFNTGGLRSGRWRFVLVQV